MFKDVVSKIRVSLETSDFDAILVFGSDNVNYLSGAHLPFLYSYPDRYIAVLWPRNTEPVCVCPVEWKSSFLNQSWMDKTHVYIEAPGNHNVVAKAVAESIGDLGLEIQKMGLDIDRVPHALFEKLEENLPHLELVSCDDWIRELRMDKTPSEVGLLADVAYKADHALFGTMHHVLVTSTRSEMSLSEEIRVHALERGLDVVGHHSVGPSASGKNARKFWPLAPKFGLGYAKHLMPGEYVRMMINTSLDGYWSEGARMMIMGEPNEEQTSAYEALVSLKKTAVEHLKPGVKCSEIYKAVKEKADECNIRLVSGLGVGQGVGVTSHEPPYINASDDTKLKAGMVIVLGPTIYDQDGEIMMSNDTMIITKEGSKRVGWYKDWREPYNANYTL